METPDLTGYHIIHAALRRAPHRLAATSATLDPQDRPRVKALARYWHGYAGEVLVHHTVEDEIFFPALVERVATVGSMIERTDADHHHLDSLMATTTAAVRQVAEGGDGRAIDEMTRCFEALAVHMDAHLDFEDAEVLPLLERHFTADEYDALDGRAKKSVKPGKQAAFTVPFIVDSVEGAERDAMFEGAPLPLVLLYKLTTKRHARLERAAFGDVDVLDARLAAEQAAVDAALREGAPA